MFLPSVDRKLLKKNIVITGGGTFWLIIANHLGRWHDLADGKIKKEKEGYEADVL